MRGSLPANRWSCARVEREDQSVIGRSRNSLEGAWDTKRLCRGRCLASVLLHKPPSRPPPPRPSESTSRPASRTVIIPIPLPIRPAGSPIDAIVACIITRVRRLQHKRGLINRPTTVRSTLGIHNGVRGISDLAPHTDGLA